jgi:hypothetical protein
MKLHGNVLAKSLDIEIFPLVMPFSSVDGTEHLMIWVTRRSQRRLTISISVDPSSDNLSTSREMLIGLIMVVLTITGRQSRL